MPQRSNIMTTLPSFYNEVSYRYIFNHLVLPPMLPQGQDDDIRQRDVDLLELVVSAARDYNPAIIDEPDWQLIAKSLTSLRRLRKSVSPASILDAFKSFELNDVVPLYLEEQNAGLVMSRTDGFVLFQSFEAAFSNAAITNCPNRLVCSFPGPSIRVPLDVALNSDFQTHLAIFLEQMDITSLPDAQMRTEKGGARHVETREPPSPLYVVDFLTSLLLGFGDMYDARQFTKRIRDEVNLKASKLPWRRSPLWLVTRVFLQIALMRTSGEPNEQAHSNEQHLEYKCFMLHLFTRLAKAALAAPFELESELLHMLNVKLARRAHKLSEWGNSGDVVRHAREASDSIKQKLDARWLNEQKAAVRILRWEPRTLNFEADSQLTLTNSVRYLAARLKHVPQGASKEIQLPAPSDRLRDHDIAAMDIPARFLKQQGNSSRAQNILALFDFERWVESDLTEWLGRVDGDPLHGCQQLSSAIDYYGRASRAAYSKDPERFSIAALTICEMWMALDRLTIAQFPLLEEYSPEIPISLLEPLVLPRRSEMRRLFVFEVYLGERLDTASNHEHPSLLSSDVKADSFSVRVYDETPSMKNARQRVEHEAGLQKRTALQGLQFAKQMVTGLETRLRGHPDCECLRDRYNRVTLRCERCDIIREMKRTTVSKFEWPLPRSELHCKAAVFELCVPPAYRIWRDTTYSLLTDHLTSQVTAHGPKTDLYGFDGYPLLAAEMPTSGKVAWRSDAKPIQNSHYGGPTSVLVTSSTQEDDVCFTNVMRYRLYDVARSTKVEPGFAKGNSMRNICTPNLPTGRYQGLQVWLGGTEHTQNEVIAAQSICHVDLDLHEFISFGSLRAGERLQWMNILRELQENNLSHSSCEVSALILHASSQCGAPSQSETGYFRDVHFELVQPDFPNKLLDAIAKKLQVISDNWQQRYCLLTLSHLTRRVLSLRGHSLAGVKTQAINLLKKIILIGRSWLQRITEEMKMLVIHEEIAKIQLIAFEIALIARLAFDVEVTYLAELLKTNEDVVSLVYFHSTIFDFTPSGARSTDLVSVLSTSNIRLSARMENYLGALIDSNPVILSLGVRQLWAGLPGLATWTVGQSGWAEFSHNLRSRVQYAHFNIMTGELLVDGSPVGRLPKEFSENVTYQRLFGKRVLEVFPVPSNSALFESKGLIEGHRVTFQMHGADLAIRIQKENTTFELIPHYKLKGDLPNFLTDDCFAWMLLLPHSPILEFRPLKEAWTSSRKNWQLSLAGSEWIAEVGDTKMIDIRSPTFAMVEDIFKPFDEPGHLVVTTRSSGGLTVELSRYELVFELDDGQLQSRNFPGTFIDPSQKIGTLIGLRSLLVLRAADKSRSERLVLVPKGLVKTSRTKHHTQVNIQVPKSEKRNSFYHYRFNPFLDRFEDRTRTGVEMAIEALSSATALSFREIEASHEMELLERIASLAPIRSYSPNHLTVMQSIQWQPGLTFLQQDPRFFTCVEGIIGYEKQRAFLFDKTVAASFLEGRGKALSDRSCQLYVYFNRVGSSCPSNPADDHIYMCRHFMESSRFDRVAHLSARVFNNDLGGSPNLLEVFKRWGTLSAVREPIAISFDSELFDASMPRDWLTFLRSIQSCKSTYATLFFLSALAAGSRGSDGEMIHTLNVFRLNRQLRMIQVPLLVDARSYVLADGNTPTRTRIESLVKQNQYEFHYTGEMASERPLHMSPANHQQQCRYHFQRTVESQSSKAISAYLAFGNTQPPPEIPSQWSHLDEYSLHIQICSYFQSCSANRSLSNFVRVCAPILSAVHGSQGTPVARRFPGVRRQRDSHRSFPAPSLDSILQLCTTPRLTIPRDIGTQHPFAGHTSAPLRCEELKSLLDEIPHSLPQSGPLSESPFTGTYISELQLSLEAVISSQEHPGRVAHQTTMPQFAVLEETSRNRVDVVLSTLRKSLLPSSDAVKLASNAGLWPVLDTWFWLQLVVRRRDDAKWVPLILHLARSICTWQRWSRLSQLSSADRRAEVLKELANPSETGWSAEEYPEWLLFQIENNVTIREVQAEIALRMLKPAGAANSVMQLNMGEGKSSVIMPLVAAAVANGRQLARVVVLKALNAAMFHILAERLSDICNRRIFYLPFSRSVKVDERAVRGLQALFTSCQLQRGILIASPEHILSSKLMGLDYLCRQETVISKVLMETQSWLKGTVRDVLDESDEILSVKYQLIYTIGDQQVIDGEADRWATVQQILGLLRRTIKRLATKQPTWFEVAPEPDHVFPHIRVLQEPNAQPERALVEEISSSIQRGELPGLSFRLFTREQQALALRFIRDPDFPRDQEEDLVALLTSESNFSIPKLYLLRGLLAYGLLTFALKEKRWRVDYGLDDNVPLRTMLAVPYRAKDKPDQRADFGHPEIALMLTCLSYYYGGLSGDQLRLCFDGLFKCEDPSSEYQSWIAELQHDLPENLRRLSGVNVLDLHQWGSEIYPRLRRCKAVIDFYLSNQVFPREAKEFPYKLTTNSWDLAETRTNLTTGFSGTNDNRHLLPLTIHQQDSPKLLHTNALVLLNLINEKNDDVVCPSKSGAESVLRSIVSHTGPPIRVLLDVGAQVLEMTNHELARAWLRIDTSEDVRASIYFDSKDEVMVLMRNGVTEKLKGSPLLKHLENCLVYLDEAHTRGTDLPFPSGTKAMVTIGPKLVKDKLVQGCMRMRKLGGEHSVVFFCPPEIRQQVLSYRRHRTGRSTKLHIADILKWSMIQTCLQMAGNAALWAQQGSNYLDRQAVLSAVDEGSADANLELLREREARTLEQLYSPSKRRTFAVRQNHTRPRLIRLASKLVSKCGDFGITSLDAAGMQEEQEREVAQEQEQERHQERPQKTTAASHSISAGLSHFIATGRLDVANANVNPKDWNILFPAFCLFLGSSFQKQVLIHSWPNNLLCTRDFLFTVAKQTAGGNGDFLKPVNWILSTQDFARLLILSPFEVNELLPEIRMSTAVRLHMFAPRVSQAMDGFEQLDSYTIGGDEEIMHSRPRSALIHALCLFSGQLYFPDMDYYKSMCRYLALNISEHPDFDQETKIDATTGFVYPVSRQALGMKNSPFVENPIPGIRHIANARRKGKPFTQTHVGKLVQGTVLKEEDFDMD